MITIFLARHGETENNVKNVYQGRTDSPLTKKGVGHAKAAAEKLRNIKLDVIVSSPIGRAVKTAEIIKSNLELGIPIQTDESLLEIDYGELTNKTEEEALAACPNFWNEVEKKIPGGECVLEAKKRVFKFLEGIEDRFPGQTVLIVTHGICLAAAIDFAKNISVYNPPNFDTHEYLGKLVISEGKIVEYTEL